MVNALSFASNVIVDSGASLEMWASATIAGLSGDGNVWNGSGGQTLTLGYNDASSTFNGTFGTPFGVNSLQVIKIGTGNFTITGNTNVQTFNNLRVHAGTVTLGGNGKAAFLNYVVDPGGTFVVDNTAGNVGYRLGTTATTLYLEGGTFQFKPYSTGSFELINAMTVAFGGSTFNIDATGTTGTTLFQVNTLNNRLGGGTALIRGTGMGTAAGAGVANIYVSTANDTIGGAGVNNTVNMSIRPDILIDSSVTGAGAGFAVRDTQTGFLRALGSLGYTNELQPTLFGAIAAPNVGLSSTDSIVGITAINSLTLQSGGGVTLASLPAGGNYWSAWNANNTVYFQQNILRVNSGGILALPNNNGINVPIVDTNAQQYTIHTVGNLDFNATFGSGYNVVKTGAGNLNINQRQWNMGALYVNQGTVTLNSGYDNTLPIMCSWYQAVGRDLNLYGGTLDLHGKNQQFWQFNQGPADTYPGAAGTVTSATGPATLSIGWQGSFAGTITGQVSLVKGAYGTLTLTNANNYSGTTTVAGGTLNLQDSGSLTATPSIDVLYGALTLSDQGLYYGVQRIPANVPLTLRGGTFTFAAAPGETYGMSLGTVTVPSGQTYFNITYGSYGQSTLTINDLKRQDRSQINMAVNTTGNPPNSNLFVDLYGITQPNRTQAWVSQINDQTLAADNALIAPWLTVSQTSFAVSNPQVGITALGWTGGSSPGYSNRSIYNAQATDNLNAGTTYYITSRTINSLKFAGDLAMNSATDTLNLKFGGILTDTNSYPNIYNGRITSTYGASPTSPADLYFYVNNNGGFAYPSIYSAVVDNSATGFVTLIKGGGGQLVLAGANSYSGGTVVNNGILALNAFTAGAITVPAIDPSLAQAGQAGLVIENGTVNVMTFGGQIAPTNTVTMNGSGILNLIGANTIAGLTMNSYGCEPVININSNGTLIVNGNITSHADYASAMPRITGGLLDLGGANRTVTVDGTAVMGLVIGSTVANGGITKMGSGMLSLGGNGASQNLFNGGLTLREGSLLIAGDRMGGGMLTIGSGTTILSDAARNVYAPLAIEGNFTFGGYNSVNLYGTATLPTGGGGVTITTANPQTSLRLGGPITGAGGLTKNGPGSMYLSAPNAYTGTTTVSQGVLYVDSPFGLPLNGGVGSDLVINTGAVVSINSNVVLRSISGGGVITSAATVVSGSISNGVTLYLNTPTGTQTLPVLESTGLAVTKLGANTMVYDTPQIYYGATNIWNGELRADVDNAIWPVSPITLANGLSGASATWNLNGHNQTLLGTTLTFYGTTTPVGAQARMTMGTGNTVTFVPATGTNGITLYAGANPQPVEIGTVGGNNTLDFLGGYRSMSVGFLGPLGVTATSVTPSLTINANILNAGFKLVDNGDLRLTGAVSYASNVAIDRGVLELGNAAAVPNAANSNLGMLGNAYPANLIQLALANTIGTALVIDSPTPANLEVARLSGGGAATGYIYLGTGGTLTFGGDNSNQTFSGRIFGGSGGQTTVTKIGTGVQSMVAPNPFGYAGATLISAGSLSVNWDNVANDNVFPLMSDITILAGASIESSASYGATLGSLSGSGTIINTRGDGNRNPTWTIGYNSNSTTWSGVFLKGANNNINALVKIGTGNLTFTNSGSTMTGSMSVLGGTLTYGGVNPAAGEMQTAQIYVYSGGTLVLDNSNAAAVAGVVDRIADANTLNFLGGELKLIGNSGGSTEVIKNLTFGVGLNTITIDGSASTTAGTLLNFSSNGGATGVFPNRANGVAMLIRGTNLGNSTAAGVGAFTIGTTSVATMTDSIGGGTADGTASMSIRPDVLIDTTTTGQGSSFAVRGTAAPYYIRGLAAGEYNTGSIVTVGATAVNSNNNFLVNSVQQMFATPSQPTTVTFNSTINSLTLDGNAGINAPSQFFILSGLPTLSAFTVTSGGILSRAGAGAATVNVGLLSAANNQVFFHTVSDLNFTGYLNVAQGVEVPWANKTGSGTLTINNQQFNNGGWTISGGKVVLDGTSTSGFNNNNVLPVLPASAVYGYYDVWLNAGTLDLHGNNQSIQNLRTQGQYLGTGGTVTNSASNDVTFMSLSTANGYYTGSITDNYPTAGKLSYVKNSTAGTLTMTGPLSYHGATTFIGGTTELRDNATILNTTSLTLDYTTLTLNNQALLDLNRVPSNVPITMRGSIVNYYPAQGVASTFNLATDGGAKFTLSEGFNQVNNAIWAGGSGSSDITIGNLVRNTSGGQAPVLYFGSLTSNAPVDPASGYANPVYSRTFVTSISNFISDEVPLSPVSPLSLVGAGNMLPGWIMYNDQFASYDSTMGVVAPGVSGSHAVYATGNNLIAAQPNDNVSLANNGNYLAGAVGVTNRTIMSLRVINDNNMVYLASATDKLTATVGFISNGNNQYWAGGQFSTNSAAANDIYFYNAGSVYFDGKFVDSLVSIGGSTKTRLVKTGGGNLFMANANAYTGDTVINAGTLTLNSMLPVTSSLIPAGNIVINGATLTVNNFTGQFPSSANTNVTMMGASGLNLVGGATIGSLTMNSYGGSYDTINVYGVLSLVGTGSVNAISDAIAGQPVIQNGIVDLGGARTINVTQSQNVPQGLRFDTVIRNGSIVKTGNGALTLSSYANSFNGLDVQGGTVIVTGGSGGAGAVGVGPITLADGTGIMTGDGSGNTIGGATIYNPITIKGNIFLGQGPYGGGWSEGGNYRGNISLLGQITLTNNSIMTTTSPFITNYLGVIHDQYNTTTRNQSGIVKNGPSTMALLGQGATDYSGPTVINSGVVRLDSLYVTSPYSMISISAGAFLNVNGQTVSFMGPLDGSGTLTNSSTTVPTLYIGGGKPDSDGMYSTGTFSGQITTNNNNQLNLVKIGSGTQFFNGTTASPLGITIVDGTFTPGSDGKLVATWPSLTFMNFQTGGTGILDLNTTSQTLNNKIVFGGPLSVPTSQGKVAFTSGMLTFALAAAGNADFVSYLAAGAPGAASMDGPGTISLSTLTGWRQLYVEKSSTVLATQSELTISANLVGANTAANSGILKNGPGALTLSNIGGNAYLGQTVVNGGTIRVTGGGAIPNTSQVWLNSSATYGAVFDVLQSETIGSLTTGNTTAGIASTFYNLVQIEAGQTLTIGADNASPTYNGRLNGASDSVLIKIGTGTQNFNGPMAYGMTGTIKVNSGTLTMTANNAMPYLATLSVNSPGTFNAGSANTVVGTLAAGNGSVTGTGGTLTVGYSNVDSTFNGVFPTSSLNMAKMGTGTLSLTSTNAAVVSGSFTINDGTLRLTKDVSQGAMNFANTVINTGGTLTLDNTNGSLANRLTSKAVTLSGGTLNLLAGTDAVAAETTGAFTVGSGQGRIVLTPAASRGVTLTLASLGRSIGGTAVFTGTQLGTGVADTTLIKTTGDVISYIGQSNLAGTTNRGILPYVLVDATAGGEGIGGFATYDSSFGIRALGSDEFVNNITTSPPSNVRLSVGVAATSNTTINSLQLDTGVAGIAIDSGKTLTIESGGILALASTGTITGGSITSAYEMDLWALSGATLRIDSAITGNTGLTKSGSGTVIIAHALPAVGFGITPATVTVNSGILQLTSGDNTLPVGSPLSLNGGTLDLGGNSQVFGSLGSGNPLPGKGGTITNGAVTSNSGTNTTFAGSITDGAVASSFRKSGLATVTLSNVSSYSGATAIDGGTLRLADDGRLTGTSDVGVNYAALLLDNSGLANRSDRLSASAPITLRAGTLTLQSAPGAASTQTVGTVTLAEGANVISTAVLQAAADLTLSGLSRTVGTVNFVNVGTPVNDLYGYGATAAGRVWLTAPTLVNGILGGWATVNGTDFATYGTAGVASPGQNGTAVGYTALPLALANATDNVSYTGTLATAFSSRTINSLRVYNNNLVVPMASATDTLTLASGGLLSANNNNQWITGGQISAGYTANTAADLFTWVNQDITHVTSAIINNGAGALTLHKAGPGTLGLSGVNQYTGGTVVNQGALNLEGAGQTLKTGSLTINGGAVAETTVSGQIANGTVVTMNGGSLTMLGNHTLPGLTLTAKGGTTAPAVTITNVGNVSGTLTLNGGITATNDIGGSSVPVITGGKLDLGGTVRTINVNGIASTGLNINSSIVGTAGIDKQGTGTLLLTGSNSYSGPTNISAGTLKLSGGGGGGGGTGGVFSNVAEAAGYTLAYSLAIGNNNNYGTTGVPYSVNNAALIATGSFSRVGYYLELQQASGPLQWVYASFDAVPFQTNASMLGVPTVATGEFYHYDAAGVLPGQVRNMNVYSNVSGIVTGMGIATGSVQFWPSNYSQANDYGVPNASASAFDWGDGGANTGSGHSLMTIANYGASQMLISFGHWNIANTGSVGIGNQVGGQGANWTFNDNVSSYTVKNLQIVVGNPGSYIGSAIPALSPVTIASGATLDVNGSNSAIGSLSGAGNVINSTTIVGTLFIGGDSTSTTFSGSLSGNSTDPTRLVIAKFGTGVQTLSGVSTYTGKTVVNSGGIRLYDGGKLAAPAGVALDQLKVLSGGTFTLDNTGTNDSARITGSVANFGTTLAGGTFAFMGNALADSSQTMGDLTLQTGASVINIVTGSDYSADPAWPGTSATLTFASFNRTPGSGATLNITTKTSAGAALLGDYPESAPNLVFSTLPAASGIGLLSGAVVNGSDFALFNADNAARGVFPMTVDNSFTGLPGTPNASSYGLITGDPGNDQLIPSSFNLVDATATAQGLGFYATIGGLKLLDGSSVHLANGMTLTINNSLGNDSSGGIIKVGGVGASTIGGSVGDTTYLQAGPGGNSELFVFVHDAGETGSLTINSIISSNSLVKGGAGILILGAENTYSGTTFVNEGTLRYGVANAIPGSGTGVVVSGRDAVLDLNGVTNTLSIGSLTVNAGSVTNSGSGGTLIVGGLTVGGGPAGSSASLNLAGTGAGTGKLLLQGDVVFDATNNPNTATIAGNLDLNGVSRIFTVGDSIATGAATDLLISASISDSGATLTKAGAGNLRLSGNNTFNADVSVNAGILTLASNTALGTPVTSRVTTVGSSATLALDGGITIAGSKSYSVSGLGVSNATLTTSGAIVSLGGTNTLGGLVSLSADATLASNSGSKLVLAGGLAKTGTSAVVTLVGNGDFEFSGTIGAGAITGLVLSASQDSVLTISNTGTANAFSAPVTINTGTLRVGTGAILTSATSGVTMTLAASGVGGTATLDLNGSNQTVDSVTFGGAATGSSQGIITTGAGALKLAPVGTGASVSYIATGNPMGAKILGILDLGDTTDKNFVINDSTSAQALSDLDISAQIKSTGATQVGFVKTGAGQLTLSGAASNTYSGLTTVTAGTLMLNKDTAGTNAIAGNLLVNTGGLVVLGKNDQISDTSKVTVSGGTFLAAVAGSSYGVNAFNETVGTLATTTTGGTINTGTGALTAANFDMNGGTINVQGAGFTPGATSGGKLVVASGATGMVFNSGTTTINLLTDPGVPYAASATTRAMFNLPDAGRLVLDGSMTVNSTTAATVVNINWAATNLGGQNVWYGNMGYVDLDGGTRTINVNSASTTNTATVNITSLVENGSITTLGAGGSAAPGYVLFAGTQGPFNGAPYSGATQFSGLTVGSGSIVRVNGDFQLPYMLALTVNSGGTFDTWLCNNLRIGSLAGNGTVTTLRTNNDRNPTVMFGLDNTDTTFSGNFVTSGVTSNFTMRKIGTGTWTYNGGGTGFVNVPGTNNSYLLADEGVISLAGSGTTVGPLKFKYVYVDNGGKLIVDNTAGSVDRLDNTATTLVMRGGTLNFIPNATTGTTETVAALSMDGGASVINLSGSAGGTSQLTIPTLNAYSWYGTVYLSAPKIGQAVAGAANINTNSPVIPTVGQPNGNNGTTTMSIRPDWVAVDSTTTNPPAFVVRDSVNGFLRPLADSTEYATFAQGMGANNATTNQNVRVTGTVSQVVNSWVNSLTMDAGSTITLPAGNSNQVIAVANTGTAPTYTVTTVAANNGTLNTLDIYTGGLLVRPGTGTATISGGLLTPYYSGAYMPLYIQAFGDLNLDTLIQSDKGVTKAGSGTVTISRQQWNAVGYAVNGGRLVLASTGSSTIWGGGGNNTLTINSGAGWWATSDMVVNAGTLDLNGRNQIVNRLWNMNNGTNQTQSGIGGVVTSTAAATLTIACNNSGDSMFGGDISGLVTVIKGGLNYWNISSPLTYAAPTKVVGGIMQLINYGKLVNTTSLDVNFAEFRISENDTYTVGLDSSNRLPTGLPITLRGATFSFYNSADYASSLSVSTVTMAQGQNILVPGISTGGQTDLYIDTLVRASNLVTVSMNVSNDGMRGRLFLNRLDPGTGTGADPTALLTNGILGGWAVVNTDRFATYIPGVGVTGLGYNNSIGQSAVNLTQAGPTDNVDYSSTTTPLVTTRMVNSLRIYTDATSINMASTTDRLTIASGGLIQQNNNNAFNVGQLSAGASPDTAAKLYVWNNGAMYMNGTVVNNGSGAVTLVKAATGSLILTGVNTYTGGTVVNQGTLTLGATVPGTVTLPEADATSRALLGGADLTIYSGATVTMANFGGQIAAGSNMAMIGAGTLNLIGENTLGSLNFVDSGGGANASVNIGLGGTLTLTGNITVTNDNPYGVPYISQGVLDLNGHTMTISVSGSALGGMGIASSIRNGGIQKMGAGVLALNAPNQFSGDFLLKEGTLNINANNALGGGRLITEAGTSIIASTGNVRIGNPITIHDNLTLTGQQAFYVDGQISTDQSAATLTVDGRSPYTTFYLGQITGPMTVVKTGTAQMRFNMGSSDYTGDTLIQGGIAVPNMNYSTSPNSRVVLYPGTVFDLNSVTTSVASILDGPAQAGVPFGQIQGAGTLITGLDGTSTTYSGTITGGSNIIKVGTGTWTLNAANYYTGTTYVNQGTLQLNAIQGISPLSAIVLGNADGGVTTLNINGLNINGATFSTRKQIVFGGANGGPTSRSTLDLNNATLYDDYSGTVPSAANKDVDMVWYNAAGNPQGATISGGTIVMATSDTAAHYQAFRIEKSGSVPAGQSELTISANLQSGTLMSGIIKWGAGALTLSGTNTYTGYTRMDGGTIRIGTASSLPTTTQVLLNGNTNPYNVCLFDMSAVSDPMTIGSLSSNAPGGLINNQLVLNGGGLTFGGDNSTTIYTGLISGGPAASTSNALIKVGTGVFTLGAPNPFGYTGGTWINGTGGSSLKLGAVSALPYSTAVNVAASNILDINNQATVIGSLTGAGTTTNSAGAVTVLTVGFDNTSTTFSGALTAATAANLALTKIGTGTLTMTAALGTNTAAGALIVNGGALSLAGASGGDPFATVALNSGGTLTLDNSTATANRLADTAAVNLQGGLLNYIAGASVASTETIGTLAPLTSGASTVLLNTNSTGSIALTATVGAAVNGATIYVQGANMTTSTGTGYTNLIAATWPQTAGQGGALANGTPTMPIRADMVGLDTASTNPPTFLTKANTSTNLLRPLAAAEMTTISTTNSVGSNAANAANNNILIPTGVTTRTAFPTSNQVDYINSLTLAGGATLNQPAFWFFPTNAANYAYETLAINTGGILVQPGAAVNINLGNGGIIDPWYSNARNQAILYNFADVNLSAYFHSSTPYFTKSGSGALTMNYQQFYAGGTAINGGSVSLASPVVTNSTGNNPLPITPVMGSFTLYDLWVNSGTLDLVNKNQMVLNLRSTNPIANMGGVVTNSGTGTSVLTVAEATAGTFGGNVNGNLSFIKAGNTQLTLTSPNAYNGFTTAAGSILELKDQGTIRNTTALNVNYGALQLSNLGLANINDRVPTNVPVALRGGTITLLGALGATSTQSLATVTALQGDSTITATAGTLGIADVNIGSFTRSLGSVVNFTGANLGGLYNDAQGYGTNRNISHILLGQLNGADPMAVVNANNGILGGWAIALVGATDCYFSHLQPDDRCGWTHRHGLFRPVRRNPVHGRADG